MQQNLNLIVKNNKSTNLNFVVFYDMYFMYLTMAPDDAPSDVKMTSALRTEWFDLYSSRMILNCF